MSRFGSVLIGSFVLLAPVHAGDFNGDGFDDLAIGVSREDFGAQVRAGGVSVLYGSAGSLSAGGDQFFTVEGFGLAVLGEENLGEALAVGDFNGDTFDDLAMGCPGANVANLVDSGRVLVIYGSATGLDPTTLQSFHQDTPGITDAIDKSPSDPTRSDERFGRSLCAGDFDGNGCDDLVISVRESFGVGTKHKHFAGAVHVLRGTPDGLVVKGSQFFHLDAKGIPGVGSESTYFGDAMAAGDIDGDGCDELAVGAFDQVGTFAGGSVTILRGKKKKGLAPKGVQRVTELDCTTDVYPGTLFGSELAFGDLNGDGRSDLAIGARGANVGTTASAGVVYLLMGTSKGVVPKEALRIAPGTVALPIDVADAHDIGETLEFGDFNGDGNDDLAIGAPLATVSGAQFAGCVYLVLGSQSAGPKAPTSQTFAQGVLGVPDSSEFSDQFGAALAAGDFNGDGFDDLAVGAPVEGLTDPAVGVVITIRGFAGGLSTLNAALWSQDTGGIIDSSETGDRFGTALGS